MAEEVKANTPAPVMPWQQNWETKAVQPPVDVLGSLVEGAGKVIDNIKAGRMPWEMDWKPKETLTRRAASGKVTEPAPEPKKKLSIAQFVENLVSVESGGNPNARNPKSTAVGLGQFTEGTWLEAVKAAGKNYTLDDRTDPQKSKEILKIFTEKNRKVAVDHLGREPDATELYMYHLFGRSGAKDFVTAPKDKPAIDYVSPAAVVANKNIFYEKGKPVTVGDVFDRFKNKFEKTTPKEKAKN